MPRRELGTGGMTAALTAKYNPWNRLTELRDAGSNQIAEYEYDAWNRRIGEILLTRTLAACRLGHAGQPIPGHAGARDNEFGIAPDLPGQQRCGRAPLPCRNHAKEKNQQKIA
jgi:YD repeat-containing protein